MKFFFSRFSGFDLNSCAENIRDIPSYIQTHYNEDNKICSLSKKDYQRLIESYAITYKNVLQVLAEKEKYQHYLKDSIYFQGEVIFAIRYGMAQTIMDFMARRTTLFLEKGRGLQCIECVADLFQEELDLSDEQKKKEIENYKKEIHRV